jgi:3-phenylpropionate/cinnamic acid dioxygenase small subunit
MTNDATLVTALLARVDQLESRTAMRDLVTDYCQGFDRRNWERFLAIWWQDCIWNIGPPFGKFEGHAGIRKAIYDVLWPAWRESHHLTSNLRITFQDADHASSECDVDCMGALADHSVQMISATYYDWFERRGGVWKIRQRDVTIHYFNPIPGAQLTAPK